MRYLLAFGCLFLAAGCTFAPFNLPVEESPYYQLPVGSKLVLQKAVEIPAGRDQVYFQNGRAMDWHQVNIYLPHCTLKATAKQEAAQPIHPDEFVVARSYSERFFKRVHAPDRFPAVQAAAFGQARMLTVDLDQNGNMDYEVVAMVMEVGSARQPQIRSMVCADWGLPQDTQHITVRKMRHAIGEFFRIVAPEKK